MVQVFVGLTDMSPSSTNCCHALQLTHGSHGFRRHVFDCCNSGVSWLWQAG